MDYRHPEAENTKFIIPKTRRPTQPGLEVTRYAEEDAVSPQVVEPTTSFFLDSATSPTASLHGSPPRRQRTRGASGSSNPLQHRAESAISPRQTPSAHSPRSLGSRAPIVAPPESSHRDVTEVNRQVHDFKLEEPLPSPRSRKKLILGLPVLWFWGLIVLMVLVLAIGVAVGIAVGLGNS